MKSVTTDQLQSMMERGERFTLINSLPAEHFEDTHLPGATNVPLDSEDFAAQVERHAGGKDEKIVVYCASQQCDSSTKAAKKLEEAGFTNVFEYEGGAQAWQEAGKELVHSM